MDASQLFSRCLRHLLMQHPGCLLSSTTPKTARHAVTRTSRRCLYYQPTRSFNFSVQSHQNNVSNAQPEPQNRDAGIDAERQYNSPQEQASRRIQQPTSSKAQEAARRWRKATQDASERLDALVRRQTIQNNAGKDSSGSPSNANGTASSRRTARPANSLPDISAMLDELTLGRDGSASREPSVVLRMKPTLGRQVDIEPYRNMDVTRAFQVLEHKCNKGGNSVKADERNQKTHVRAGQKRKIVRRMRWRNQFREGFLQECARVRKMIKQGW